MEILLETQGAFGSVLVELEAGETFFSESGAMFRASSGVDIDVTTKPRGAGGVFAGVKRVLAGDSFFLSKYTMESSGHGEVGLAPVLQGGVRRVELDGSEPWICAGGSYLGSGPDLAINTQFQGLKGFFSGESLFFLEITGSGPLLLSAFGHMEEIVVDGGLVVDTGHVVAFTGGLQYSLSKAGGSWLQSWLAGEGVVMNFSGRGRILVQSHNPKEYGRAVGASLPPRKR